MGEAKEAGHRQRLRDRFLAGDDSSRTDVGMLELLLTYSIPRKDVKPLAQQLIDKFGSLRNVLNATPDALRRISGIDSASAVLIKLVDGILMGEATANEPIGAPANVAAQQGTLFDTHAVRKADTATERKLKKNKKVVQRRGTDLFGKAILKEAIDLLPCLPDTESLDEIRAYLRANLHYNSEQTRHRNSDYIVRRMFPQGYTDYSLRMFARLYPDSRDLREVCFYRFMKAEPLTQNVIDNIMLPSIGNGRVNRGMIKDYLMSKYPNSRSINECTGALVSAFIAGGIVKADHRQIKFTYREIPIAGLAFILYSEFPEPGMYDLSKVENNQAMRAMLWNPTRLLPSLYELRNVGLISKISEIDDVRQFTTRWTLEEVVHRLVSGSIKL